MGLEKVGGQDGQCDEIRSTFSQRFERKEKCRFKGNGRRKQLC